MTATGDSVLTEHLSRLRDVSNTLCAFCAALSDIRCEEAMVQFEIALKLGQCKIKRTETNEGDALVIFNMA